VRVLHVVLEPTVPQRLVSGGARALVESGHEVAVCTLRGTGPLLEELRGFGVVARALGRSSPADRVSPAEVGSAVPALVRFARQWRPDVVHGHEPLPAIAGAVAARSIMVPSIFHRHHFEGSRRLAIATAAAAATTTATIAVAEAVATEARRSWPRHRPIVVAHNGLDIPMPTAVPRSELLGPLPPEALVLVCVGRLHPEKGHRVLLDSAGAVADRTGRPVVVVLVGDGPERERLQRASPPRGAVDLRLVGWSLDALAWLVAAEVVVLPSLRDACPLVAVEAMATGRPIVASSVGGLPELVIDGETGALVPSGDPAALAEAIAAITADPLQLDRIGAAARRRYEQHFTAAHMVERWRAAYEVARTARS
jgi:glycosyltransferase involved in cell wall biosynthesis